MKTILCFGDSNTWGWNASCVDENGNPTRFGFDTRWPGILQRELGSDYRIIEEALNGRTTAFDDPFFTMRNGLAVLPMLLETHTPIDLLIIMLGGNDTKRMYNMSPGEIAYALELLVIAAVKRYSGGEPPKILIIAPPHNPEGIAKGKFGFVFGSESATKSRALSQEYKSVAQNQGCFFLDAHIAGAVIDGEDQVHMGESGHAALGKAVAQKVIDIFES